MSDTTGRNRLGVAALAALSLAWAAPSLAEEVGCLSFGAEFEDLSQASMISLARVADAMPRVNFVKRDVIEKGCPNSTAACRDKAYLVPGDEVVIFAQKGEFVCAIYVSAKGRVSDGWLPRAAVTPVQEQPVQDRDWLGTWRSGPEQEIVVGMAPSSNKLTIKGDASWGASDPGQVQRGAVHVGELQAEVAATGAELSFGMGENGTLSHNEASDVDCKVQMRRLGPYLLAKDNNMCGGVNVSFTGVYRRVK